MNETEWLADLEAKADAATPGPWVIEQRDHLLGSVNCGDKHIAFASYNNCPDKERRVTNTKENAAFIASANPETIKRLVRMIEYLASLGVDADKGNEDEQYQQNLQWAYNETEPKE